MWLYNKAFETEEEIENEKILQEYFGKFRLKDRKWFTKLVVTNIGRIFSLVNYLDQYIKISRLELKDEGDTNKEKILHLIKFDFMRLLEIYWEGNSNVYYFEAPVNQSNLSILDNIDNFKRKDSPITSTILPFPIKRGGI